MKNLFFIIIVLTDWVFTKKNVRQPEARNFCMYRAPKNFSPLTSSSLLPGFPKILSKGKIFLKTLLTRSLFLRNFIHGLKWDLMPVTRNFSSIPKTYCPMKRWKIFSLPTPTRLGIGGRSAARIYWLPTHL